jgi:hypothetical protein
VHVKIEFVYLSDFSAFASITEAAHLSLFIVVTRSLVPHVHLGKIDVISSFPYIMSINQFISNVNP